jgi:hypothetical protein
MSRVAIGFASLFPLCQPVLQAQTLAVSVETGISTTQLATPDDYWGARTGWLLGASGSLSVTPWLAVQAGLRLHEKGAADPGMFEMRIRYLEFPFLVHIGLGAAAWRVRPLVTAGLAPATELSCAARAVPPYIPEAPVPPMRPMNCISDRTDLWDLGLLAGAGAELRIGSLRGALVVQYTRGVHDIASGYPMGFPVRNRATSIILSASMPVSHRRPSH